MQYQKRDGVFGAGAPVQPPPRRPGFRMPGEPVDWICGSILAAAVLLAVLFWEPLSDALFFRLLFPLLSIGGTLSAAALPVLGLILWLKHRFRRY